MPRDVTPAAAAALTAILEAAYLMSPDSLPRVVADGARHLGSSDMVIYVPDYEQSTLTPCRRPAPDPAIRCRSTGPSPAGCIAPLIPS